MEYYQKYIKYKTNYLNLKNQLGGVINKDITCANITYYAKKMSEKIPATNSKGENYNINLKFKFLDNKNECIQEAKNFLKNEDKNMSYLISSLQNAGLDKETPSANITNIIIVAIGSSSTQAYYFEGSSQIIVQNIELGNGAWYGVQNHEEDVPTKLNEMYENITRVANEKNKKYIIIHKSGSFGIKHYEGPNMVVRVDKPIDQKYKYSDEELKDVNTNNAFTTFNQLINVILEKKPQSDNFMWLSVANFNCFDADWLKNIAEEYFKKFTKENNLYIMDFGGGSDSLCEVTRDGENLKYKDLFKGKYDQKKALSFIDRKTINVTDILNGYKNVGSEFTIKEQIIDTIKKLNLSIENINVRIYQTGVQREWANSICQTYVKDYLTEKGIF
jgi:hypothetical protein